METFAWLGQPSTFLIRSFLFGKKEQKFFRWPNGFFLERYISVKLIFKVACWKSSTRW